MNLRLIEVIRTPAFLKWCRRVWSEDEYAAFRIYMALNPEAGRLVPGTAGVRKIRWRRPGTGKSKGVRVIYYFMNAHRPLYLLMGYSKSDQVDLTPREKDWAKAMVKLIKDGMS